jgi:alkylhydroperoxidase family enzyme
MAWIETVADDDAEGLLARLFQEARHRAGRVYNIVRLMSRDPAVLQASMGLYMAVVQSPRSPLPRWFRELIAVEVSRQNDCFY